jgi:chaperone modulatory protein CbpM
VRTEEAVWLHEQLALSTEELCELSGLSPAELRELVDCGVLAPIDPQAAAWTFGADRLMLARRARRLRSDFELDAHGLALMLALLERVRNLEAEIRDLRARFPGALR